ncbi:uncharacterized protein LOC143360883 isoform X2 [Halictus rubicundus]|uniref:uncharacterized protein LOC143360883 isoform X2 n=1 Tax=Halictus rubicundus TaxID=77578 RepID=UPI004035D731
MEWKKAICLCLLVLASLQQISATKKALLGSILGELKPQGCDNAYGIIGGNPMPLPTPNFDLIAELLNIRRLLERGCSSFGSPLSSPLGGLMNSPLSGLVNSPLSGLVSSPLSGSANSPVNGPLSSPVSGPLSSPGPLQDCVLRAVS